jgi:NhaP-type Na+/H+ or K+/H+ antiporter
MSSFLAMCRSSVTSLKRLRSLFELGSLLGWLLDRASELGWTSDQSRRVVVLLAPLVTYAAAVAIGGNGFVAAFVCGIAFRYVHRFLVARRLRRPSHPAPVAGGAPIAMTRDFALLEDVTALMTMAMWFVVGLAGVPLITVVDLPIVLFCVLALTVLRIAPVSLALAGTQLSGRERLLLGLLGPRGTTTIVFGLLAFNALPDGLPADTILITTILCVVGSVVLHGIGPRPRSSDWRGPGPRRGRPDNRPDRGGRRGVGIAAWGGAPGSRVTGSTRVSRARTTR